MPTQLLAGMVPEYVRLDIDKETEDQTEYQVMPLNGMVYAQVLTEGKIDNGLIGVSEASVPIIIKHGLVGWKNMLNDKGEPVEFSRLLVPFVPGADLYLLAQKIFTMSMLAQAEKKT